LRFPADFQTTEHPHARLPGQPFFQKRVVPLHDFE
jgi:hypothetical protein